MDRMRMKKRREEWNLKTIEWINAEVPELRHDIATSATCYGC